MSNGYTYRVRTGEMTDMAAFARLCAGGDTQEPSSSEYQQDCESRVVEVGRRLEQLRAMSDSDKVSEATASNARMAAFHAEIVATREVELLRYMEMRRKVEAWVPPSPDHKAFKLTMLSELDDAIEHDCRAVSDEEFKPLSPDEWWRLQVEFAERDVASLAERIARMTSERDRRVQWRRLFEASLACKGSRGEAQGV